MHQAITWANVDPVLCRHMTSLGPNELTHCPLGIVKVSSPNTCYGLNSWALLVKLPSCDTSICWLRWWLGAIRQQAITSANFDQDLGLFMLLLGRNKLKSIILLMNKTEWGSSWSTYHQLLSNFSPIQYHKLDNWNVQESFDLWFTFFPHF